MDFKAIEKAMRDELENPQKCYLPNSPTSFVRDRLLKGMWWDEAYWYWQCACSNRFPQESLNNLHKELKKLEQNMPEWGTKGT